MNSFKDITTNQYIYSIYSIKNNLIKSIYRNFNIVLAFLIFLLFLPSHAMATITKGTNDYYGIPSAITKAANGDLYYAFPVTGNINGGIDTKDYKLYKWDPTTNNWTYITNVNSGVNLDQYNQYYSEIALSVDSSGKLYAAIIVKGSFYSNGTYSYTKGVYFGTYSGSWNTFKELDIQGVPQSTNNTKYRNIKMQVNSSGEVSIVYNKNSNIIIQTGQNSNSTWSKKEISLSSESNVKYFINSLGNFGVVYTTEDEKKINFIGSPYNNPEEVLNGNGTQYDVSGAAVDSSGKVFILYASYDGGFGIASNTGGGGSWEREEISTTGSPPFVSGALGSLIIDSNNNKFFIACLYDPNWTPTGYYVYGQVAGSNKWTVGFTNIAELNDLANLTDITIFPVIPSPGNLMVKYFDKETKDGYIAGIYRDFVGMLTIDTQPADQTVNMGGTATLSVAASGGASLSYQWYSNIMNSMNGGTLIPGATNATYAVPTGAVGTTYYYVVVTNTDDNATGQKTSTVMSNVVKVTVNTATVPVSNVTVNKDTLVLRAGGMSETLLATVEPNTADQAVQWSSSDPTVATVSSTGVVTPVSAGTAIITVASEADPTKKATCSVLVRDILLGDVNMDGWITSADAFMVQRFLKGTLTLTDLQKDVANVNLDGDITKEDSDLIVARYLGKIPSFPRDITE